MDVLAVILTCSLYTDDALVRAIVDNAHDNPLSILTPELDPETGAASSQPQTLHEAVRQVRELTALGAGLWGQLDLTGDMQQWTLDWSASYVDPSTDCAYVTAATGRMIKGGASDTTKPPLLLPTVRYSYPRRPAVSRSGSGAPRLPSPHCAVLLAAPVPFAR